jgi:hypothetical protein
MVAIESAMLSITVRKSAICSSIILVLGGGRVMGLDGGVDIVNREGRVRSVVRQRFEHQRRRLREVMDTKMLWLRQVRREKQCPANGQDIFLLNLIETGGRPYIAGLQLWN